jgi:hypothetical protein
MTDASGSKERSHPGRLRGLQDAALGKLFRSDRARRKQLHCDVRPKTMTLLATPTDAALLWCEGGEDFFKARVSPQRIPKRQQFQLAIGEAARGTDGDGKLFAGEIFVANPRGDHR